MQSWINLTKLTFLEVVQGKTFKTLLVVSVLAPLFGILLSTLFLVDIGKVYMDGVTGVVHALSIVFILFIAAVLLARDMEQKVCYFLLTEPVTRNIYIYSRFTGLMFAFFVLIMLLAAESSAVGHFFIATKAEFYRSGFIWVNMVELILLHAFQYIALLGFIVFIASWATGVSEIMLFSVAGVVFSWAFPPILLAMQNPDVLKEVPGFLSQALELIYQVLPHLNGGVIALELTHGHGLHFYEVLNYLLEHISYTIVFLMLAVWLFKKRDL